jgi:hypothetical protein
MRPRTGWFLEIAAGADLRGPSVIDAFARLSGRSHAEQVPLRPPAAAGEPNRNPDVPRSGPAAQSGPARPQATKHAHHPPAFLCHEAKTHVQSMR